MTLKILLLEILLSGIGSAVIQLKPAGPGPFAEWSNSWAVEIEGGNDKANEIAHKHGFTNLGQVYGKKIIVTVIIKLAHFASYM